MSTQARGGDPLRLGSEGPWHLSASVRKKDGLSTARSGRPATRYVGPAKGKEGVSQGPSSEDENSDTNTTQNRRLLI